MSTERIHRRIRVWGTDLPPTFYASGQTGYALIVGDCHPMGEADANYRALLCPICGCPPVEMCRDCVGCDCDEPDDGPERVDELRTPPFGSDIDVD